MTYASVLGQRASRPWSQRGNPGSAQDAGQAGLTEETQPRLLSREARIRTRNWPACMSLLPEAGLGRGPGQGQGCERGSWLPGLWGRPAAEPPPRLRLAQISSPKTDAVHAEAAKPPLTTRGPPGRLGASTRVLLWFPHGNFESEPEMWLRQAPVSATTWPVDACLTTEPAIFQAPE